ncbi:DUF1642 domain-containing protein [Lactococcus garvieae]|uniref:DUF1642 domain-containing protein n=1 Tax=Lactococcus garvieae TaxID=1363 RepID=UPI002892554C|nr:DUF1642 domain-containing protein [Lactococcus garvieae]MDT2741981.1 DUF1642 domain-containing protein [Lactococcus garvieae]
MKKFEEEFNYLIELSGKVLTGQIEVEKFEKHRTIFLNKYAEKQQSEIPEFVATEIERLKNDGAKTLSELYSADIKWLTYGTTYLNGNDLKLAEWFYDNTETFELAFIYGYTVAKEKRFYLKNKLTGQRLIRLLEENGGGFLECVTSTDKERMQFTQSEIDSMAAESYEQIEVAE